MLIVPDVADFGTFRGEAFAETEKERAEMFLQQAVDAIWILTGLDRVPSGIQMGRIFQNAVFDLALWLKSQDEHRAEINAPYSGERIGSYSYQKLQQSVETKTETGIYWFDLFLKALWALPGTEPTISVTSENVFNPEGYTYEETRIAERWETYLSSGSNYVQYENGR